MKSEKVILSILLLSGLFVPLHLSHVEVAPAAQMFDILGQTNSTLTFSPSLTISPRATSTFTAIPTVTMTPSPTDTPVVVTVIHTQLVTRIVNAPTLTSIPTATITNTVTATPTSADEKDSSAESPLSIAILGMVATFIAGLVIGTLVCRVTKR